MEVRDLMTPKARVKWVYPNATLVQAARLMGETGVGALPVLEGDRVAGIVTDRDCVVRALAEGKDPQRTLVREVMSRGVQAVRPEDDVDRLRALMEQKQIRRVVVLEDERLMGIVALADLARHAAPELVGQTVRAISR